MWVENDEYDEHVLGPKPDWYHLLSPKLRAWRESEVLRGRNPDEFIQERLVEAGDWRKPAAEA